MWTALNAGIDYNLSAGQKTFAIGGREVGTILDGFVLSTANLDTYQLDNALNGSSGFLLGDTLTVNGNYTQSPGATMAIDIGSANSYNKLTVNGTATLGGMLDVSLVDNYQPQAGDVFEILSASNGFSGTFNQGISWPALSGLLQWDINYDSSTKRVLLEVTQRHSRRLRRRWGCRWERLLEMATRGWLRSQSCLVDRRLWFVAIGHFHHSRTRTRFSRSLGWYATRLLEKLL